MSGDVLASALDGATPPVDRKAALGKLADLLDRQGISIDEVGSVTRASAWQSMLKNKDGEAEVHDLVGIQFSPKWESGPEWPVIAPGPVVKIPRVPVVQKQAGNWNTAVVLPDMQVGYYRSAGDELEPLHDETAIRVALQIIARARPAVVVLVGDNADFAEFGRYRLSVAFQRTTQATIDRLAVLAGELRAAAPSARIVWLAGNHEERLPNYILDNARAAFGLRRGNTPESWPVLSLPFLCRFDDHAIEYLPGYPASSFWINQRLRVIHGDKVTSGGSTAHKYLATEKTSVIYGHIHRREWAERTREDHDGPKTVLAASPGCLARINGVVPSTKGGLDLDGRPVPRTEDWQQGVAVVEFQADDGPFSYEQIAIHDGWARWRGRDYGGTNR